MRAAPFEYVAPRSVDDLTRLVGERGDAARTAILAGGQSLMPLLVRRDLAPATLIDINGLADELGGIDANAGDGVRLGTLVRQRAAELDRAVAARVPLLSEALPLSAKVAIRTRGTVGGSLAHADPAAEIPTAALALDALIEATGPRGDRTIAVTDFFTGPFENALACDEFLTAIVFPDLPDDSGSCFLEISPRHADRAIVAAAATVTIDRGRIARAHLALANVGTTPIRATRAETALTGQPPDPEAIEQAAAIAAEDCEPATDVHASASYRRHVVRVLAKRALTTAIERTGVFV